MFTGRPTQVQALSASSTANSHSTAAAGVTSDETQSKMAAASAATSVTVTSGMEKENNSPLRLQSASNSPLARRAHKPDQDENDSQMDGTQSQSQSSPSEKGSRKLRIVNINEQNSDGAPVSRPAPRRAASTRSTASTATASSFASASMKYPHRQPSQPSTTSDSLVLATSAPLSSPATAVTTTGLWPPSGSARESLLKVVTANAPRSSSPTVPPLSQESTQDDLLTSIGVAVRKPIGNVSISGAETPPKKGLIEPVLEHAYRRHGGRPVFGAYRLGKTLGEGQFGKVKHAVRYLAYAQDLDAVRTSGRYVNPYAIPGAGAGDEAAIKLIRKSAIFKRAKTQAQIDSQLETIKREIGALKAVCHPNIVKIQEVIETENYIGIALEYSPIGDLLNVLNRLGRPYEAKAQLWAAQLCSAVSYMHECGLIHRDLKPENILLDRKQNILVSDLGFANFFDTESARQDLMMTACGSPLYASPELFLSRAGYHGRAADVWSCGVIIYVITSLGHPWPDAPEEIHELYDYIMTVPLEFPDNITPICRDLLEGMLDTDYRTRSLMSEVLDHIWFEDYEDFTSMTKAELEQMAIMQARNEMELRASKYAAMLHASQTPHEPEGANPLAGEMLAQNSSNAEMVEDSTRSSSVAADVAMTESAIDPVKKSSSEDDAEPVVTVRYEPAPMAEETMPTPQREESAEAPTPPPKDKYAIGSQERGASSASPQTQKIFDNVYPSPRSEAMSPTVSSPMGMSPVLTTSPVYDPIGASTLSSETLQEVVETAISGLKAPSPTIDAVVCGLAEPSPFFQNLNAIGMSRTDTNISALDELRTLPDSIEWHTFVQERGESPNLRRSRSGSVESTYETVVRPSNRDRTISKTHTTLEDDAAMRTSSLPADLDKSYAEPLTPIKSDPLSSASHPHDDLAPTPPPKKAPTPPSKSKVPILRRGGSSPKGLIPKAGSPKKLALERAKGNTGRRGNRQSAPPGAFDGVTFALSTSQSTKTEQGLADAAIKRENRHRRGLSIDSVRRLIQPGTHQRRWGTFASISERLDEQDVEHIEDGVDVGGRLGPRAKQRSITRIAEFIKPKPKDPSSSVSSKNIVGLANGGTESIEGDQDSAISPNNASSLQSNDANASVQPETDQGNSLAAIARRRSAHIKRLSVNRLAALFAQGNEKSTPALAMAPTGPKVASKELAVPEVEEVPEEEREQRDASRPSISMSTEQAPDTNEEHPESRTKKHKVKPVFEWIRKRSPVFASKLH